jgi:hypothetical protein
MTPENMTVGTIVKNSDGVFRKVLAVLGGEGELTTYAMSICATSITSDDFKTAGANHTAFELKERGYVVHSPDEPVEMTVEEISKQLGKTIKVVE